MTDDRRDADAIPSELGMPRAVICALLEHLGGRWVFRPGELEAAASDELIAAVAPEGVVAIARRAAVPTGEDELPRLTILFVDGPRADQLDFLTWRSTSLRYPQSIAGTDAVYELDRVVDGVGRYHLAGRGVR